MPSRSEITQMIIRRMGGRDPVLPKYKDMVAKAANRQFAQAETGTMNDASGEATQKAGDPPREVMPHDPSIKISPPLKGELKIRGKDNYGEGDFGVRRTKVDNDGNKVRYNHPGVDLEAEPGTEVFATLDGNAVRFDPYGTIAKKQGQLNGLQINNDDGEFDKLTYVRMRDDLKEKLEKDKSLKVKAGDHIGYVEDITKMYPGIKNHLHV